MKYLSGFVTGFLAGGGAVCAALLYLHCTGTTNLHMLDPRYVRELYQPKARWIRNHFDYSYHGRHYRPHYARPEYSRMNPDCAGCAYENYSADHEPCKTCNRAFDGYPEDHFTEENACYWCKHKNEANAWPCTECLRLVEGAINDWYEYKEDEPEAEAEEEKK